MYIYIYIYIYIKEGGCGVRGQDGRRRALRKAPDDNAVSGHALRHQPIEEGVNGGDRRGQPRHVVFRVERQGPRLVPEW